MRARPVVPVDIAPVGVTSCGGTAADQHLRHTRHFQRFILTWSAISALNCAINIQTASSGSLVVRTFSLGVLLVSAGGWAALQTPAWTDSSGRDGQAAQICSYTYAALFAVLGLPNVVCRLLFPQQVVGLEGLHRGASITFILGVLALLLVRMLGHLKQRGLSAEHLPRWNRKSDLQLSGGLRPITPQRGAG